MAKSWNPNEGCHSCVDNTIKLDDKNIPSILIVILIDRATPFIEEFFEKVYRQTYSKTKIDFFIYVNDVYHEKHVTNFIEKYSAEYKSVKTIIPTDNVDTATARELAM